MINYTLGLDVRFKHRDGDRQVIVDGVVNGQPIDTDPKTRLVPVYVPATDQCVMVNELNILWKFRVTVKDMSGRVTHRRVKACDAVAACELATKDRRRLLEATAVEQLEHVQ